MSQREDPLTDAYVVSIELIDQIREGYSLYEALTVLDYPFEILEDSYPEWHPAPYSFPGMLKLFLYYESTGWTYRELAKHPELAEVFDLDSMPDESVMSRTWRGRFD